MTTALNSHTLMSLFTAGGIARFIQGTTFFSDNSGSLQCQL